MLPGRCRREHHPSGYSHPSFFRAISPPNKSRRLRTVLLIISEGGFIDDLSVRCSVAGSSSALETNISQSGAVMRSSRFVDLFLAEAPHHTTPARQCLENIAPCDLLVGRRYQWLPLSYQAPPPPTFRQCLRRRRRACSTPPFERMTTAARFHAPPFPSSTRPINTKRWVGIWSRYHSHKGECWECSNLAMRTASRTRGGGA